MIGTRINKIYVILDWGDYQSDPATLMLHKNHRISMSYNNKHLLCIQISAGHLRFYRLCLGLFWIGNRDQLSSSQSLIHVWLFANPWTAAWQASLSISNSQCLLKLMLIKLVVSSISSSVVPFFSFLQSFPASRSFWMTYFLASDGQIIGTTNSGSIIPMNEYQDWFSSGLTGLISWCQRGCQESSPIS